MSNFLKICFLSVLSTVCVQCAWAQNNLVLNPGFELRTDTELVWNKDSSVLINAHAGDTILDVGGHMEVQYWNYNGKNGPYSNALFFADKAHSGNMYSNVGAIYNNQLDRIGYDNLVGNIERDLSEGDSIIISFWVYEEPHEEAFEHDLLFGISADSVFWWRNYPNGIVPKQMDMLDIEGYYVLPNSGTEGWRQHEIRTIARAGERFVYFVTAPKMQVKIKNRIRKQLKKSRSQYRSLARFRIDDVSVSKIPERAYGF